MDITMTPPVVFILFILLGALFLVSFNGLAPKGSESYGKLRQYASGQDIAPVRISPEYSHFFPFAFSFTLMHVAVLIIATVPQGAGALSLCYILIAALAIYVLVRR